MASFTYRDNRWQVRVRRQGYPSQTRSFLTKQDAERWSRSVEREMDQGAYFSTTDANKTTFGELIQRYVRQVLPSMKGQRDDTIRLNAIARRWIADYALANLTPEVVARYRDERLRQVAPGTVVRELAYISSIINHARKEWGVPMANPVSLVRKPNASKGRLS
jgi:integrase